MSSISAAREKAEPHPRPPSPTSKDVPLRLPQLGLPLRHLLDASSHRKLSAL